MIKKLLLTLLFLLAASPFFVVDIAHAQTAGGCQNGVCTYVPLEPLPCPSGMSASECQKVQSGAPGSFPQYVSFMFRLFISLGALFAVLMMVLAGISYMTSSSPLDLSKAKDRMWKALYGLLLLVACWLILYTINPNLLRFALFTQGVPPVANSGAQPLGAPTYPDSSGRVQPSTGSPTLDSALGLNIKDDVTSPTGRSETDYSGNTIPFMQSADDIQKVLKSPLSGSNCAGINDLLSPSIGSAFIWAGVLTQRGASGSYDLQQSARAYANDCATGGGI